MKRLIFTLCFAFISTITFSQSQLQEQFRTHIEILAADSLEGRMTASEGERKAAAYIINYFKNNGIDPHPAEPDYLQSFDFTLQRTASSSNTYLISNRKIPISDTLYPLYFSGSGKVTAVTVDLGFGINAPELDHSDYAGKSVKGKIAVIDIGLPDGLHPHSKFSAHAELKDRARTAVEQGAVAVLFINKNDNRNPSSSLSIRSTSLNVPILFLNDSSPIPSGVPITIAVEIESEQATGNNIVAYLDNDQDKTIVLGAHYDHLGYGHQGSLYRGEPAIHNGADDNASGVAMIMELANYLNQQKNLLFNVLILGFSGEELGLYGSNFFTKEEIIPHNEIAFMLNFDMVGRLDTADPVLALNGTGTSPFWESFLKRYNANTFTIKTSKSGIGPSDHTSFYLQDIPVLHFFTGTHEDYHKPSDDPEKINLAGMTGIYTLVTELIKAAGQEPSIPFTKTKDESNRNVPRFKVTLGVVPDYMFDGEGMRIAGVTEGKPASKAGLIKGDVVVQIGEYSVTDMMSYMEALSKFESGNTTTVHIKRNDTFMTFPIRF